MNAQETKQLSRLDLIAKVKELGIKTIAPAQSCKTSYLQEVVDKHLGVKAEVVAKPKNENTLTKRILELAAEGYTKIGIFKQMKAEGVDRIRYGYILLVLKVKGVTVPKAERVTQVKATVVEDIKAIEELVASAPEVTEEAPE